MMWYLAVFVPASEADQAAAVAAAVWPDDPGAQLSVPLADSLGRAWQGGNAALTDDEIAALQGLAAIPDARWYRYATDGDRSLGAASHAGPTPGTPWGWAESLADGDLSLAE